MKLTNVLILAVLFFVTTPTTKLFAQSQRFQLIKRTVLGGEGGWDYLYADSEGRRLYVSHGDQVEVIDMDSHQAVGIIKDTKGVHGIYVASDLGKGFITNGKANTVTIFDLKSLKSLSEVKAGENPDALLYDKFSRRAFIFNNDSKDITVIEGATGNVVSTFSVGGNPEAGVSNGKGLIFVNVEDTNELVAFDAKTLSIKYKWSLSPGEEPNGVVLDVESSRLFSACRKSQSLLMLDASSGKIITQVPIGKGVDGVVFDNSQQLIITSNGEGSLTIVHEDSPKAMSLVETVTTEPGARTIALDSKTHHVFVVTAQYGAAPAATTENPRPRRSIIPGTFVLLEYGKN